MNYKEMYELWYEKQTSEEAKLEILILRLESLFDDMCFAKDSITEPYLIYKNQIKGIELGLTIDNYYFTFSIDNICSTQLDAYTDVINRRIVVDSKKVNEIPVILHEMIHAHESIINEQMSVLKEILLIELYNDLKNIYDKLDTWIFNHANIHHQSEMSEAGGEHSILFLLKSLDLDHKCKFEPFTVFGYNYKETFKKLGLYEEKGE